MNQIKKWDGSDLEGLWEFTRKIDGVRARLTPLGAYSRSNKPLYNLGMHLPKEGERTVEVFMGSWEETITAVRTHFGADVPEFNIYDLDPIDKRLDLGRFRNPDALVIEGELERALDEGYEGLVLRQGATWLKVKAVETYDVTMTGFIEGKGQHAGRLGAILTNMGKVGTGFSHQDRDTIWKDKQDLLGRTVEVLCMELTAAGRFRHPRFVRLRPDKM